MENIGHNKCKEMAIGGLLRIELKGLPREKSSNKQSILMISLVTHLNSFICGHSRKCVQMQSL